MGWDFGAGKEQFFPPQLYVVSFIHLHTWSYPISGPPNPYELGFRSEGGFRM